MGGSMGGDPTSTADPAAPAPPRAAEPAGRRWRATAAYHALVFRRLWRGSAFTRLGGPLLTLFAVGWGVGALVDRGQARGIPWHETTLPYAVFVVPAILTTTAMLTGFGEGSWPVLGAIKWQGTYHAMLATPLGTGDILRGHAAQLAGQLALMAAAFVGLAAPFGVWWSWWALATVGVAVLTGLGFGLLMTALSAHFLSETWFTFAYRVVLTPLLLFSGTYFPIEQLPAAARPIAWVTPLWHGVESARALGTGLIEVPMLLGHLGALLGFVVGGWWLAARALRRRLVT